MNRALISVLLTASRRSVTALISLVMVGLISSVVVWYLDERCAQLGFALLTLIGWIIALLGLWWLIIMALSPWLILPSVIRDWVAQSRVPFSTSQRERDAALREVGLELEDLNEFDPRHISVNQSSRFRLLFCAGVFGSMFVTHLSADRFITRLQSVGFSVVQMRSAESAMRLKGLNMIIEYGPEKLITRDRWGHAHISAPLEEVMLKALDDPHEGVRARAAFTCGLLEMKAAVEPLRALALNNEALRDAAILALSLVPMYPLKPHPARSTLEALSRLSTIQESSPLAIAIAIGRQKLHVPKLLRELYQENLPLPIKGAPRGRIPQEQKRVREAIAWALGELDSKASVSGLALALRDPEQSVRCIASYSFERLVLFESSQPLQRAFERSRPKDTCEYIVAPQQEGVAPLILMRRMSYQLALMRALATTDDPELLEWMAAHQREANPLTQRFMFKYHEALSLKDRRGKLKRFRDLNRERRAQELEQP